MRFIVLFSLLASTSAFVVNPASVASTTSLGAATAGPLPKDDWSDKPLGHIKETTPVAERKVNAFQRAMMKDVIISPDYFLAWSTALLGPLIWWYHPSYAIDGSPSLIGVFGGGFHILFAALLWVQTMRVRCVFEKDAFEFYNVVGPKLDLENGAKLVKKPDNYVAGTVNRWKYDSITNYGFFPSEQYPVICYFKETQTPKEKWNRWFAAFDSYGRGQPHFFPGICNVRQFKEQMESRGVKRKPVPTPKNH
jgi:hypothetical protein